MPASPENPVFPIVASESPRRQIRVGQNLVRGGQVAVGTSAPICKFRRLTASLASRFVPRIACGCLCPPSTIRSAPSLPKERRWAVMERINHRTGCHFFTACRPQRPSETYRIDFTSDRWLDAVLFFHYRCGLEGEKISRPGWRKIARSMARPQRFSG
jgi:hypothetical protein